MQEFIKKTPKAQLHIHIEGTLQPKLVFKLSKKNNVPIAYETVEQIADAYKFANLQQFLKIHYTACGVLKEQEDFQELAWGYFVKCNEENIKHTQIQFDPQTHTTRGVAFQKIIKGLRKAQQRALKEFKITSYLIMCFLRHLSQESALKTLQQAEPYRDWIIGVGLDSSEIGNPPQKFMNAFQKAGLQGYRFLAHAGQQGPPQYIWGSINNLKVQRIDHGCRCVEDKKLIQYLRETQIRVTCCPISNICLKIFPSMKENNLKYLLDEKINVTVNSDDPAYFKGYLNQNYLQVAQSLNLSMADIKQLAINSFRGSFLPKQVIQGYVKQIQSL